MNRMTDEKLEKLLADYYESEPSHILTYRREEEKPSAAAVPFGWKRLAAAASLVLVTALSIGLYFLFGNKTGAPLAVAPSSQSATTPSAQRGESDGDAPLPTGGEAAPTEPPSTIGQIIRGRFPSPSEALSGSLPTNRPSTPGSAPSSGQPAVKPTERPANTLSPAHTSPASVSPAQVSPTQVSPAPVSPTHVSPAPVSPTQAPPIPVSPTEPPENSDPTSPAPTQGMDYPDPWDPHQPPSMEDPTQGDDPWLYPTAPEPDNYCYAYIPYDGGNLYCVIEDKNGAVMGDPDRLSSQHLAEIVCTYPNGYVLAQWSPNQHGVRPPSGIHHFYYLNESGETVFEDNVFTHGVD